MTKEKFTFTDEEALRFHFEGRPGKLEIVPTKPLNTQRDLALAYSPGVAVPCLAIAERPDSAYDYTNKGNLVAVISNGTAILGLGNLGGDDNACLQMLAGDGAAGAPETTPESDEPTLGDAKQGVKDALEGVGNAIKGIFER